MNSGSVDSLKLSARCGWSRNVGRVAQGQSLVVAVFSPAVPEGIRHRPSPGDGVRASTTALVAGVGGARARSVRADGGDRGDGSEIAKGGAMPRVDPETREMVNDRPEVESESERGAKTRHDQPRDADPTGSKRGLIRRRRAPHPDRKPTWGH
jgi:hypothetical protein